MQLCTVLDYLHTRQPPIIFRDLKPANIMLTPAGDLYLIDFGLARHFKPGQTKDTVAFGSAGYAAPEQYGKAQTTTQADIYSLGATLHQMLSGHDPADSPFLFALLDLAEPAGLEALIFQMLETHPSKRPASMAVIKQDLQRMAADLASGRKPQQPVAAAAPRSAPPPVRPVVVAAPSATSNATPPLLLYRGHKDRVNTVAWSPDGKTIASGGSDRTIQIWESASGTTLRTFPAMDWVYALAWSPDGEQLAWVSRGRTLHIWEAATGNFRELFIRHLGFSDSFLTVAWSPDGSRLAAGGLGKTVEIWEVKTGQHLLTCSGHKHFFDNSGVYAVIWSPDGKYLASGGSDRTVRVWDVAAAKELTVYYGHAGEVNAVAWSPDSTRLASAGDDATVRIWRVK